MPYLQHAPEAQQQFWPVQSSHAQLSHAQALVQQLWALPDEHWQPELEQHAQSVQVQAPPEQHWHPGAQHEQQDALELEEGTTIDAAVMAHAAMVESRVNMGNLLTCEGRLVAARSQCYAVLCLNRADVGRTSPTPRTEFESRFRASARAR